MKRPTHCFALLASIVLMPMVAQTPPPDYRGGPDYRPGYDSAQQGPPPGPRGLPPGQQDEPNLGPENDPAHGVARISLLNGEVSVRRGDSGDVVAAAMNAPLMSQDRVLTSSSSRAEVEFDSADVMRVGSNSEVHLNDVRYDRFQVQLAIGRITFRVRRNNRAEVDVDTPSISFRPLGPGRYRVTVRDDGSSEITVREGEAEIFGPRGSERVRAGSTILARGSASDPEFQQVAPIGYDDWDRWNEQRDRQMDGSRAYQYVSPDIVGAEDMEGYGQWTNDPAYGNVWVPRVEPGWAPYRAGRWVWEDFYGWTWVSYDPWGWAPYHYGRWYCGSLGWAWYPGPRFGHHYWSPALVAFFGFGGHGGFGIGIGFGFGNVGWVPLAPYERFHPWWGRGLYGGFAGRGGLEFARNTRIVNNINITNVYRNARVNNGITAVGSEHFGRHTGQFMAVNGASIRDAGVVHGVLPVTPDRASLRLADRAVRTGAFPQARNVTFAAHGGTSTGMRVPFEQQQRVIDQAARRTFSAPAAGARPLYRGNVPGAGASAGAAGTGTHGWSRFGEPIHGAVADTPRVYSSGAANAAGASAATSNWHRFGGPSSGSAPAYSAPQSGARQPAYDSGSPYAPQSAPRGGYSSAPQYSAPSGGYSYGAGSGSGQPVRINPPMVHERSAAPSYGGGAYSGGGSRPAPSYSGGGRGRSAPSYSGGGGGGRYSGGSGGGSHSSAPSHSNSSGGSSHTGSSSNHGGGRR